jgi:hypothetical protein
LVTGLGSAVLAFFMDVSQLAGMVSEIWKWMCDIVLLSLMRPLWVGLGPNYFKFKSVFDSVVAGAFQITFRAKIHVNDVFLFFKNYFWHQHIKTI